MGRWHGSCHTLTRRIRWGVNRVSAWHDVWPTHTLKWSLTWVVSHVDYAHNVWCDSFQFVTSCVPCTEMAHVTHWFSTVRVTWLIWVRDMTRDPHIHWKMGHWYGSCLTLTVNMTCDVTVFIVTWLFSFVLLRDIMCDSHTLKWVISHVHSERRERRSCSADCRRFPSCLTTHPHPRFRRFVTNTHTQIIKAHGNAFIYVYKPEYAPALEISKGRDEWIWTNHENTRQRFFICVFKPDYTVQDLVGSWQICPHTSWRCTNTRLFMCVYTRLYSHAQNYDGSWQKHINKFGKVLQIHRHTCICI